MNILLIHAYFLPPDAAGSVRWNAMAQHWADAGHRITVIAGTIDYLTGKPYPSLPEKEQPHPKITVVRARMPPSYAAGPGGRLKAYLGFAFTSFWVGVHQSGGRFDVVLATSPPLTVGLTGWLLARWWGVPLVLELRDLWPDAPISLGFLPNVIMRRVAFRLERFLYRQARHIVVLTPGFRTVLTAEKTVRPEKISVIPNGVDFPINHLLSGLSRKQFREKNGMADGFWIVYAGAHGRANGLAALLPVAEKLQSTSVHFLLIGDGPEKANLQAETTRRGLTNVHFRPTIPKTQVLPWLSAADVGLVLMQPRPVFDTMLSAKLFDYFAARLPVFTAIGGQSRAVVEAAGAGFFVDVNQPETWLLAINTYRENPDLAQTQGQAGYEYARMNFDREKLAGEYLMRLPRLKPNAARPGRKSFAPGRAAFGFSRGLGRLYKQVGKRLLDLLLTTLILAVFWPLLLLLTVVNAIAFRGNPVFTQLRTGRHEQQFRILKFRTMTNRRDPETSQLLPDINRLTRWGRFLRRMSLDELPQLVNVLRGEMSLVGPRPLLADYEPLYTPEQRQRHCVWPGITGWAQVNGRNALTWPEKFTLDTWYVENVSLGLDLRILWLTIGKVLQAENEPMAERFRRDA